MAKRTGTVVSGIRVLGREADTSWVLANEVRAYLQGLRDYLWIVDETGYPIFTSSAASDIGGEAVKSVTRVMLRQPLQESQGILDLTPGAARFRYYLMPVDSAGPHIRALLLAAQPRPDESGPQQLLITMILLAPLILVASAVLGSWLAGRSLRPVGVMIEELRAIQDGRSLHRRLAVPAGDDEISRLGSQLNAMLGRVEQSFMALRRFTAPMRRMSSRRR